VGPTIVVPRGRSIYLLTPPAPPREFPRSTTGPEGTLPSTLVEALARLDGPIVAGGAALAATLSDRLGAPVRRAQRADWHMALGSLPPREPARERDELLARARMDLEEALRSPEEILISLAREEERFARAMARERRASEAFVAVPGTLLTDVARDWERARDRLAEHHAELRRRLEAEARRLLPNLSAIVGARTAAGVAAAAGGTAPLARMSASRLQLLGARRRPGGERGPRHGLLFRADGAEEVPPDRRGAYLRSVAALAAIAARADVLTHRDLAAGLLRRREARSAALRRRRT
jgi:hypothetical protein